MFSKQTIKEIGLVARENALEPAALLAVAEVESAGKAFVFIDGKKEPLIRFEGHYFDRLINPSKRAAARKAGLAAPKWGVVKNPRRQADRWKMLERAMRLDASAALQSVSWGIGQVMGSHWKALGYSSPQALSDEARRSVAGQVRLMVRFIRVNNLADLLHARDWAGFARRYNGPAYKKNRYDTRIAAAYVRHKKSEPVSAITHPNRIATALAREARNNTKSVRTMQRLLTAAGYPLKVDGDFGVKTEAALRAFQKQHGLVADGVYGPVSRMALERAVPVIGDANRFWKMFWRIIRIITFGKVMRKF